MAQSCHSSRGFQALVLGPDICPQAGTIVGHSMAGYTIANQVLHEAVSTVAFTPHPEATGAGST